MKVNSIIERIHKLFRDRVRKYNIQGKYVDDADPWMEILLAAAFTVRSTYHRTNLKSPIRMVFGQDMILTINQIAN